MHMHLISGLARILSLAVPIQCSKIFHNAANSVRYNPDTQVVLVLGFD